MRVGNPFSNKVSAFVFMLHFAQIKFWWESFQVDFGPLVGLQRWEAFQAYLEKSLESGGIDSTCWSQTGGRSPVTRIFCKTQPSSIHGWVALNVFPSWFDMRRKLKVLKWVGRPPSQRTTQAQASLPLQPFSMQAASNLPILQTPKSPVIQAFHLLLTASKPSQATRSRRTSRSWYWDISQLCRNWSHSRPAFEFFSFIVHHLWVQFEY